VNWLVEPSPAARIVVPVIASLMAMWAFFLSWPLYQTLGQNLLPPWAPDGAIPSNGIHAAWMGVHDPGVEWVRTPTSPVVRLTASPTGHPILRYVITNPEPADTIIVRGSWRGERIQRGEYGYSVARALFFVRDREQRARWDLPHTAAALTGTRGWHAFERCFHPPPDAGSWTFALAHQGNGGTLECSRLEAVRAVRHPAVAWVFAAWALLWVALAAHSFRWLQLGTRRGGWALAAWTAVIWAGMWVPDSAIARLQYHLQQWANAPQPSVSGVTQGPQQAVSAKPILPSASEAAASPSPPPPAQKTTQAPTRAAPTAARFRRSIARIDLHKAGHLVVFAVFAWLAQRCFEFRLRRARAGGCHFGWIALGFLLVACWAESLQWLTLTRRPRMSDIGLNLVAIAFGLLVAEVRAASTRPPQLPDHTT
jgi:hypothetical protein